VSRQLEVQAGDGKSYGQVLQEYARTQNGFEWMVDPVVQDGQILRRWVWGYPQLGTDTVHVVQQGQHGGDITRWAVEIDPLRGATYLDVRGGVPETQDTSVATPPRMSDIVTASAHIAAGWPRIDRTLDHPGRSTSVSTLNSYASYWMARLGGAVWVRSVSIALAADSTITPSQLGDRIRHIMINEMYPLSDQGGAGYDETARMIGIAVTPHGRGEGKDVAELVLEQVDDG
jgi:hypothetical protein